MAHAITTNKLTRKAEMAYVGETPWHGLGQALIDGASIDEWKVAAGMNWEAKTSAVEYRVGDEMLKMPEKTVIYRSDTKDPLGVVSDSYKIVQPGEVLEFFRDLTEQYGFKLSTAGTLFGGRRFWALAKSGQQFEVGKGDLVGEYLLLSTSVDGSLATTARPTGIRVVCNNTLSLALKGKDADIKVSHRSQFDADKVKAQLAEVHDQFKMFGDAAAQLTKVKVNDKLAEEFLSNLLHDTKTIYTEDATKTKQYVKIMDLFHGEAMGATLPDVKNTMWGLFNSITEFVDHHAKVKTIDARLNSAWYGRGDDLKKTALERALELV